MLITPVQVELRYGSAEVELDRKPFSLAIVLDVSGSMAGSYINRCKEAIKVSVG